MGRARRSATLLQQVDLEAEAVELGVDGATAKGQKQARAVKAA
jgi:hypothetical protein